MSTIHILSDLVGGQWHYLPPGGQQGLTMVHTFTWQVPDALLVSSSQSPGGESFGYWYWHPAEHKVKMIALGKALDGVSLAEYTEVTRHGDLMICHLLTHDDSGTKRYREEWRFTDRDHYDWTLYALSDTGEQQTMQASFERRTP